MKSFLRLVLVLVSCTALIAAFMLIRARYLPEVDVPILLYERVSGISKDKYTVPTELFYQQLRDMVERDYKTVTPFQLRAYKTWGIPLPQKPFMITFDFGYQDLLSTVSPILEELDLCAVINLATTYIAETSNQRRNFNGEQMLTWNEIREARRKGIFYFGGHTRNLVNLLNHERPFNEIRASRTDIRKATGLNSKVFSYPFGAYSPAIMKAAKDAKIQLAMTYGDKVAKIGPHTDFLCLPRIRVVGGQHGFSAKAFTPYSPLDKKYVAVSHPVGPAFPAVVRLYESGLDEDGRQIRISEIKVDEFSEHIVEIPLPENFEYPLIVDITDETSVLLYFSVSIPKSAVERYGKPERPNATQSFDYEAQIDAL